MAKPSNLKNSTTNNLNKTQVDGDSTINRRRMLTMGPTLAVASVSANSMSSNGALAATALIYLLSRVSLKVLTRTNCHSGTF
jgi:hypothetical protein